MGYGRCRGRQTRGVATTRSRGFVSPLRVGGVGARSVVALLQPRGQPEGVCGGRLVDFGQAGGEQGQRTGDRVEVSQFFL